MGSSIEKVQRDEGNGCIDAGVVVSLSAMQEKGREGPDDLAKGGGASDNAPHVRHVPLELSDRSLATLAAARGSYKTRYIEECSSVYVFVVFLGSSAFTITQLCVVLFKDYKYYDIFNEVSYLSGPASYGAFAVGLFLQPRNDSVIHKIFLVSSTILCLVMPEVIELALIKRDREEVLTALIRVPLCFLLLAFGLNSRGLVAKLSDKRLSRFLTDSLFIPAITTLGIFVFLALDPVRCWLEEGYDQKNMCNRTRSGQCGLAIIILINFIVHVALSVFPKKVIEKRMITIRKFATFNMTVDEMIKIVVHSYALCCAFFLFAQYNARGEMTDGEESFLAITAATGICALVASGLKEWAAMKIESLNCINDDDDDDGGGGVDDDDVNEREGSLPILRLHKAFQHCAFVVTLLYNCIGVVFASTEISSLGNIQAICLPFVTCTFFLGLFADPRSGKRRFEVCLFCAFAFEEVTLTVRCLFEGQVGYAFSHITRGACWCLLFHFLMKWRERLSLLGDQELSNFFLNFMLKNMLKNLTGMLFVTFRALNCVSESGGVEECRNTIACSTFICIFLISMVGVDLVSGTMTEQQRHRNKITWEKIATMKNVKTRHKLDGLFLTIAGNCGMFLFCMMETADEKVDDANQENIVWSLGFTGVFCTVMVFVLEIVTLVKEVKEDERRDRLNGLKPPDVVVTEVSGIFVGLSVTLTTVYMLLYLGYAIRPYDSWDYYADILLPMVALSYVMSFFMKPRRSDKLYFRFVLMHFLQFAVVCEIFGFIGTVRKGLYYAGIMNIIRIPIYVLSIFIGEKVRKRVAELPSSKLSMFLVQGVLVKGTAAFVTVAFFTFEVIACILEESDEKDLCRNTSSAALWLSVLLSTGTLMSIINSAVSQKTISRIAITRERLAIFDLNKKETVQLVAVVIVMACSLMLLSNLGVAEVQNSTSLWVGMVGSISFAFVFIIETTHLLRKLDKVAKRSDVVQHQRSRALSTERKISSGGIVDGMTLGGMV